MKTDILVEPEVKGSEQLYKEIYMGHSIPNHPEKKDFPSSNHRF